ncbi:MAG TPA: glycine cleavage T C-terminal barrel domain-containing protein, partial [Terriglobales bacterium]|nr:glycine cleavage T C-terminal barrel domain-containing protein [Terriglobales bacterium]
ALLALQGPRATEILGRIAPAELAALKPFSFREIDIAGVATLASRTGYTGEDGWELYCDAAGAPQLWDALLEAGQSCELRPAGLGARDTLRLERALPLYGHELDEQTTPLEARLAWVVRFSKPSFLGREALLAQRDSGLARRLAGLEVLDRGIARQGYELFAGDEPIGVVTSGTMSPTLGKAIAMGYVATRHAEPGVDLQVEIRGRKLAARTVPLPFYKR